VWVWAREPRDTLLACGGSLARWAAAGVALRLVRVRFELAEEVSWPAAERQAAAALGITELSDAPLARAISDLGGARPSPSLLVVPGPIGLDAPMLRAVLESLEVCRPRWIAFHDGVDLGIVNLALSLGRDEAARRHSALAIVSEDLARAADGLSEYRAFTGLFEQGCAEAYFRLSADEVERLAPGLVP